MKPIRLLLVALILLVVLPVQTQADAITINSPAEGSSVKPPVKIVIGVPPNGPSFSLTLEVAHGTAASSGFMNAAYTVIPPDTSKINSGSPPPPDFGLPTIQWDAAGFSGGPYTLRVSVINHTTNALIGQAARSISLDAPDFSPVVSFNPPSTVSGRVSLQATVQSSNGLQGWRLEYVDAAGARHGIGEGGAAGAVSADWDSASLPDGTYTLTLTAWDNLGNQTVVSRSVTVKTLPPSLRLQPAVVEAALVQLPVTYTAAAPVRLTVRLHRLQDDGPVANCEGSGEAGNAVQVAVVCNLQAVAPGSYGATVQAVDAQGRAGSLEMAVTVLAPVPLPTLDELPAVSGGRVTLQWSLTGGVPISGLELRRSGPDGNLLIAVPAPGTTRFVDTPTRSGTYAYTVAGVTADGRRQASSTRSTVVDLDPPELGPVSVSAIDGYGLQLRWDAARDDTGVAAYRVFLSTDLLIELPATARSFSLPLSPGTYRTSLVAVDLAGNSAQSGPLPFEVRSGAVALIAHGKFQAVSVPGFIEDGRTFVPLRFFAEALGYRVLWDSDARMATVVDAGQGRVVQTVVDRSYLQVLDSTGTQQVDLPAPPRLVDGRVMVPLRALAEALGATVHWDAEHRTVEISGGAGL